MKNIAYLFFLLFFYSGTQAQLHDKTWLTGYGANWQPDSVFGNIRFTFSDTGVVIKRDSLGMNFDRGSSTTGRICGNSTQNTYTGLLFKGTSTETKIISNQIRTHSYGLWVRDGAISPQGVDSANHRNQWTAASYPQRAALHYDPSQAEFQYFFYPSGLNQGSVYYPNNIQPTNWFKSSPKGTLCCPVLCMESDSTGELNSLENTIVNNAMQFGVYEAEQVWQNEQVLFVLLLILEVMR